MFVDWLHAAAAGATANVRQATDAARTTARHAPAVLRVAAESCHGVARANGSTVRRVAALCSRGCGDAGADPRAARLAWLSCEAQARGYLGILAHMPAEVLCLTLFTQPAKRPGK